MLTASSSNNDGGEENHRLSLATCNFAGYEGLKEAFSHALTESQVAQTKSHYTPITYLITNRKPTFRILSRDPAYKNPVNLQPSGSR